MKFYKKIVKLYKLMIGIFRCYPENANNILDYLVEQKIQHPQSVYRNSRVVVEGVYDPLYLGIFGIIISDLKKRAAIHVDFLWVHSVSNAVGVGFVQSFFRSQLVSMLRCRQWYRAYRLFVDRIAYCSNAWLNPISELKVFYRTRRIYKEIQKLPDFSSYVVDGVMVGDLIIDSYLRFRPSPKFDVTDRFVRKLISQSLRDIQKSERYFSKEKPLVYLSCYTTYIQHGLPVRVAIKHGIEVRCFPGALNFGKKLTDTDFYHSSNCDSYRHDFQQLENHVSKRNAAEAALKRRFSGIVDIATNYMKVSAYANTDINTGDVSGHVIIFLHDFYDSPHVYSGLIFVDFWTWITTTIDVLLAANINFSIKPHPNQIPESDQAFKLLMSEYPGLKVLSSKTSNELLAKSGIICGVTVYGTVAHELAYFGIPTIACAKNPHHQYDFCRTARSFSEYREFLLSPAVLPTSVDEMRKQSLEFFFMHNLNFSEEEFCFREKVASYFSAFSETLELNKIESALDDLRNSVYFEYFINDVSDQIISHQSLS
jgi:hypothetical protein